MTIGRISWRELMTPKPETSEKFYGELFGWKIKTVPYGATTYRLIDNGPKQVGGIMHFDKPGIPAHWVSYVTVDDVDATAKKAGDAGGRIANPPTDIPNVGRFAVLRDPDGGITVAFKPAPSSSTPPANDARPELGEFCWEQLNAAKLEADMEFYKKVYGWTSTPFEMDKTMGVFYAGKAMVASTMQAPPGVPSHWITYVVVSKLSDARTRATNLGGVIHAEEIPVPGMGKIAVIGDNVGAAIGLFEPQMG